MEWLQVLQGASFVGLLVVTTVAGLQRGQVQNLKTTIEGLRGDRDDLESRIAARDITHDEEMVRQKAERAVDRKRITDLELEVSALRRTVTGEVHWTLIEGLITDMSAALSNHHTEMLATVSSHHVEVMAAITKGQK